VKKIVYFSCFLIAITAFAEHKTANPCAEIPNSKPIFDQSSHSFKGCKLTEIAQGSLYEKLGFKVGDIMQPSSTGKSSQEPEETYQIEGAKAEDSPARAMELYNELKSQRQEEDRAEAN
jgi:hypothetical protein